MQTNNHQIADYDLVLDEKFGKEGTPERVQAEEDALAEEDFYYSRNIYVDITTFVENSKELTGLYIQVYPDCTNTIAWLQQHDLLPYEMVEGNFAG